MSTLSSQCHGEYHDFEFEVSATDEGERLDLVLTQYLQALAQAGDGSLPEVDLAPTRSKTSRWISDGYVRVGGELLTKPSYKVAVGDYVVVSVPPARSLVLEADPSIAIDVLYEDEDVLVLNKQAGVSVHPGAGQDSGTLVNGLLAYLGEDMRTVGDALRPGIVHRLDKDTSGAMIVAKHDRAHLALAKQFLPPRAVSRTYLALVPRVPKVKGQVGQSRASSKGVISAPIARHPHDRKKMAVVEGGKEATTHYEVVEELHGAYLLELTLETGRTHQIRVHLQHANAPIIGDLIYGPGESSYSAALRPAVLRLGRQALHASCVEFLHPVSGEGVKVQAPLPEDVTELIEVFRNRAV